MNKLQKMLLLSAKIEESLTGAGKLKLARKRLIRKAGLDDPEAYGKESFVQKDNSKESSKQVEDTDFDKRQKSTNENASSTK